MTAPFRVSGTTLKVSVDGGATGIQVGVVGDKDLTVRRTIGFVGCGRALAMGQQLALLKFGLARPPLYLLLQSGPFQLKLVRAAQVENCEPIKGKMTDHEVTWKGKSLGAAHKNGAVSLELKIPSDATAFAVSI